MSVTNAIGRAKTRLYPKAFTVNKLTLTRLRFKLSRNVSLDELDQLDASQIADAHADLFANEISFRFLGLPLEILQHDCSYSYFQFVGWFDHFKHALFPTWLAKLFPVKRKHVIVNRECDHVEVDGKKIFILFPYSKIKFPNELDRPMVYVENS